MGNDYHTTDDCKNAIISRVKIIEEKDQPTGGSWKKSQYKEKMSSKVAALAMRMIEPIHGTGRAVIVDSGFAYIPKEL